MTVTSVLIINGPNLNLLGQREPSVYGSATLDDHMNVAQSEAKAHGMSLRSIQSNSEAEIVQALHDARGDVDAIIINAGAFTHYSWAIHDAVRAFEGPVVEVHLSNPTAREEFRHVSVLAAVVNGTISGFGGQSYRLAVQALSQLT